MNTSPQPAARYVQGIAEAVHYAHERGILHRDLKPSNVLIDLNARPHVVDFGLARAYPPRFFEEEQPQFAHLWRGLDMGTAGYSPPEQYEGYVTPQSDLYALGILGFELVLGYVPFTGPSPMEVMLKVAHGDRRRLAEVAPNLPAELVSIIEKCLETRPEDRFLS
mgnify:CR=1 FL=1